MRLVLVSVIMGLLAATLAPPVSAQVPPDLVPTCIGQSDAITVTAHLQTLAAALEVDVFVENAGPVPVRFDPSQASLRTTEGSVAPWSADQVKRAHGDLGAYIIAGSIFPPFLAIAGVTQWNFNRYVNARALQAGEILPGKTLRGSIFFPMPAESQSRAVLELTGTTPAAGEVRPVRMYCALPRGASAQAAVAGVVPLTVALSARGSAGPIEVVADTVEFTGDYTAVEIRISNRADIRAEVFGAMVNAFIRDRAGNIYAGRPARSDFGDQVTAKSSAPARLVFAPLPPPPKTSAASLTLPGIRFGPEDSVDAVVEMRF